MDSQQLSLSGMSSSGRVFQRKQREGKEMTGVLGSAAVKFAATVSDRKY